jgi:hypothetical protein
LIFLSFRGAAKRLPRYAPRSAIADLGIDEPPISRQPEIGGAGMTTEFAESL